MNSAQTMAWMLDTFSKSTDFAKQV
ncbi:MAG: hypothetical protein R2827_16440 [Bdellovibrionales bacterium]